MLEDDDLDVRHLFERHVSSGALGIHVDRLQLTEIPALCGNRTQDHRNNLVPLPKLGRYKPGEGGSQGHPSSYICTNDDYTSYVLRFQYRRSGEQETAVLLRFADSSRAHPKGIRVYGKGDDFNCVQSIGDFILKLSKQRVDLPAFRKLPAGFWNECEITLNKGQLEVRVNGVLRATGMGCEQTPGKIGFEAGSSRVEYRNIVLIPILAGKAKSDESKTGG